MESKANAATSSDVLESSDYKQKYKVLKRKLKSLVYEHELLSEQLERTQKKLLRVSKDRSFLLDKIIKYEKVADTSSDSDATDQSDSDCEKPAPKKKLSTPPRSVNTSTSAEDGPDSSKKTPKSKSSKKPKSGSTSKKMQSMTMEDLEKHLDSKPDRPAIEKATSSMPADIFGNTDSDGQGSENEADTSLIIDMK